MKRGLLMIVICFARIVVFAQNGQINGKLTDENNVPIPFASVLLKNASDSILYKGEITGESGEFEFQRLNAGTYFILIKNPGYSEFISSQVVVSEQSKIDLGSINLKISATDLKAVTVEAERPFIEREADKLVVNIENSIIQTGSSVLEVFEKLPGVLVDQDGNIRIRGKQGVIVVIDGKPTALSGQDLVNMLRGIKLRSVDIAIRIQF